MMMPGSEEKGVRQTGGQIDDMTLALVDAAFDKDVNVRYVIGQSLFELGKKQPAMVLSSCHSYLVKHSKLPHGHRVVILKSMEKIIRESLKKIDQNLAVELIKQASEELTKSKEIIPDWQTAASDVLVALGQGFCNEVMEELLQKFQPGIQPHFFVVQTLGNLASANVYGIVPFLNVVLGTMLPMLGMIRHDNMKWVFTTAMHKFCEAILDYIANIERAPDSSVNKEAFAGQIYSAYDCFFSVWSKTNEPKLRLAIVEALGQMVHIIGQDRLQEQLPKLLPSTTALYRKHPENYHITNGLSMVLSAATQDKCIMLEPYLDQLMGTLFPLVCVPPDYGMPVTVKNHNELLRCFTIMAGPFSERLVNFLLQKLESRDEKTKIGALSVFRHLVNSSDEELEEMKAIVLSGLKMVLSDNSNKVKKCLAQTIIAMGHHGYLELEGGQLMIEFIVRQCALPSNDSMVKRPNDPDHVSNDALRSMCDNVLQLLTTTIDQIDVVLWPHLLEYVIPVTYTDAMSSLCKNIGHLSLKKRQLQLENAEEYELDFEKEVNVPKPPALIARLLVMIGRPANGRNRGLYVLNTMKGLIPVLEPGLVELWDTVLPKLIHYLEEAVEADRWNQRNWEDLVLKMLSKSLDVLGNEDWIESLGSALNDQISMYNYYPEEKNFLYKCLGIVMRKTAKKDFVARLLDQIFGSVRHSSQLEREGCGVAFGYAAASHLDAVLIKCENVAKTEIGKKQSGILGFFKDNLQKSSEGETEKVKATLMLCYGFITLYSPPSIIVSRLESTILRSINPHLTNVKDVVVKQNLIRSVELIGKSMHPDHLQTPHTFVQRGDLIKHLMNYIKAENPNSITTESRALAFSACCTLVKLDPRLPDAEVFELVKTVVNSVLYLPQDGVTQKRSKDEAYEDILEQEVLMEATMEAMDDLLKVILIKDLTPEGIEAIFKHLYPLMLSPHPHERERTLQRALVIFNTYLQALVVAVGGPSSFSNVGSLLARLTPRCTDPNFEVRRVAIDCMQAVLKIALRYDGKPADYVDTMVEALTTLKDRVKKIDPNILYSVVSDLSKVLIKKLPTDQLQPFVTYLQEGLVDAESHSSNGACVVLNSVIKTRGGELHTEVGSLLDDLHSRISMISCPQTKTGTLRCIRTLASHHLTTTLDILLSYPLPYDETTVDCWQVLGQDTQLTAAVFDYLLDMMQRSLPYEEKRDPRDKNKTIRIATIQPLSATCGLTEMFKVAETEASVKDHFHRLLAALMIRMASMVDAKPPKEEKKEDKKSKKKKVPTATLR